MGGVKLESVYCVKDLGVTITSNFKLSQQRVKPIKFWALLTEIFPLRIKI